MENKYFSVDDTLYEITESYPELIELLAGKGFAQLKDEDKRKAFGSKISLKQAAAMKAINLDKLGELMLRELEDETNAADVTTSTGTASGRFEITGLLPCPIRVPLMDGLTELQEQLGITLDLDLKAASQGLDWLKAKIEDRPEPEELSDLFISAGFDLFFDRQLMDHYRRQGVFTDATGIEELNQDFVRNEIDLLDPAGDYSVVGVVPAVFLVNDEELNGRPAPRSWEDLLAPEFADSISLPVSDFDLFNAILINIYKKYGEDGVEKLGRSLQRSLHPSQMVKDGGRKKADQPAVTIMPYFFTRMAKRFPHMNFVWPEDGAIISPIFMLVKASSLPEIQPVVDYFASAEVGQLLAQQGLFPSVRADIDNNLPADSKFMWPGWDFLRQEDPGQLIEDLTAVFNKQAKEVG
ncbi:MAG: ABC transporter substrate-binding protein [Bacillota bacterium]